MQALSKRLTALALTGALLVPTFVSSAEAGPRNGWRDRQVHHYHHAKPRHHRKKNNNVGAAVAAGVIGLAAGAIILGATRQPRYAGPPPVAYTPPPPPYPHAPVPGRVYNTAGYQPWSPAWHQYCSSKYRSFNPSTGTYTTYRGVQKFCQ